jgi:hypothetical protein
MGTAQNEFGCLKSPAKTWAGKIVYFLYSSRQSEIGVSPWCWRHNVNFYAEVNSYKSPASRVLSGVWVSESWPKQILYSCNLAYKVYFCVFVYLCICDSKDNIIPPRIGEFPFLNNYVLQSCGTTLTKEVSRNARNGTNHWRTKENF